MRQARRGSQLDALFRPRAVAVVGASRDPSKWGRKVLGYTRDAGFAGRLYGVNPAADSLGDLEGVTFVAALDEIDEPVDLALIALPASKTPTAVTDCARNGVRAAVLAAAGFGERSPAGRLLEDEVRAVTAGPGMRVVGPNSIGLFVAEAGLNLTPIRAIPKGDLALATQSGNVAIALFQEARRAGLGFSACVGVGNQSDVDFGELLSYFASDPYSRSVACYIEGLVTGRGEAFREGLRACRDAGKPVVVLKSGRSAYGAASAATHTGSLAADDRVWQAILDQGGAVRVFSTQEMIDTVAALERLPLNRGRVMVITNGGGDSVMAADALVEAGLRLAEPSPDTRAAVEELVPPDAPRVPGGNPVTLDTAGGVSDSPQLLASCVQALADDPGVDVVLISGVFGGYHDLRQEELSSVAGLLAARKAGMALIVQSAYADAGEEPLERLRAGGVPVYPTVQRLVRALAKTVLTANTSDSDLGERDPVQALTSSSPWGSQLMLTEVVDLLTDYGIRMPQIIVVTNEAEMARAAAQAGYPACVKLADAAVIHKSDVGGVRLHLGNVNQAMEAAEELWQRFPGSKLLMMPMLDAGFELIVGTSADATFGPLILAGRGGLWTEVEDDVALRIAPIDPAEARGLVLQLHCAPMLLGRRGQPPLDIEALSGLLSALSRLAVDHPDLSVEINPLLLYPSGYGVADFRAVKVRSEVASRG